MRRRILFGIVALALGAMGCSRPTTAVSYSLGERGKALDAGDRAKLERFLEFHCGTPSHPKILGKPPTERLQLGREVYSLRCEACHGANGDGEGEAAAILRPRPRNYRVGVYKFTSTPYGARPRRDDLVTTVRRGITGTSMPGFSLLSENEIQAVVDYVLSLTHRGELETTLAIRFEEDGDVKNDEVDEIIAGIRKQWDEVESKVVEAITPMPVFTLANIRAGKEAFLGRGCNKCHGDDGRGLTAGNVGKDRWEFETRAADLTSGMLHGGAAPIDIYRRITSGINGTPMPGFKGTFEKDPQTIWDLVAYVQYVSNRRRNGAVPQAAPIEPNYLTVSPKTAK